MMSRLIFIIFLGCISINLYAQDLTEILSKPKDYDKQEVVVSGEAIGSVLASGHGEWINVVSTGVGIGLFSPQKGFFDKIERTGGYTSTGDVIQAVGVFYANCPQHGEADIHAVDYTVLKSGAVRTELPSEQDKRLFWAMLALFLAVIFVYLKNYNYIRTTNIIKPYAARNRKAKKRI